MMYLCFATMTALTSCVRRGASSLSVIVASHKHLCLEPTTASHNQQSNSAACRASDNGDDTSHRCRLKCTARESLRKRDIYYNITSGGREGNVPQVAVEPTNQRCVPCPNLPGFERDSHSPSQREPQSVQEGPKGVSLQSTGAGNMPGGCANDASLQSTGAGNMPGGRANVCAAARGHGTVKVIREDHCL